MSKGKWMPGAKPIPPNSSHKLFSCEPCDRSFTKLSYYEKHLTTELHFKRASSQTCRDYSTDPDFFEQVRSKRSCRVQDSSRKNDSNSRKSPASSRGETQIHCPTCFSSVEKPRMGKHLVSHFHCQRTSAIDRTVNPEKSLILDNIHDIVVESPFQCHPCKFYFTQRGQLLEHFAAKHLKLKINTWSRRTSLSGWSCSACRDLLAPDGQTMMEHLSSPRHLKMEVTIGKSIPIILKEVVLQSCPFCDKKYLLHRELLSHKKAKHQGHSTLVTLKTEKVENSRLDDGCQASLGSKDSSPTTLDFLGKIKKENSTKLDFTFDPILESDYNHTMNTPTTISLPPVSLFKNYPVKSESSILLNSETKSTTKSELRTRETRRADLSPQPSVSNGHKPQDGHKCDLCDYSTEKRSHLLRHIATHKTDREKKFICEECGASFYQKYGLTYHKKLHAGKSLRCQFPGCTFMARCQSEITSHSVKHSEEGSFNCEKCSYTAKSKGKLTRHNLLQHETSNKLPKFNCKHCSFHTKLASSLKRHELTHTGEKPFNCPHCRYATRNIENLRAHVLARPYHPGKCLYYCRICLKDGVNIQELFKTNKFEEFQAHVTQNHHENPDSRTRTGLWAIAGIRISNNCTNDLPWLPQDELMAKTQRRVKNQILTLEQRIKSKAECSEDLQVLSLENCIDSGSMELDGTDSCFDDKDNSFIMSVLASPEQFEDIFGNSRTEEKDIVLDFAKL